MGKLMERKLKDYAVLMLKGMGMGAADVVPGVSGGTIAFIVGIYDELINSIKSINLESLKLFFSGKWATFWTKINGNFLFFLLAGIGISVFSLAKLITWLLVNQPNAFNPTPIHTTTRGIQAIGGTGRINSKMGLIKRSA